MACRHRPGLWDIAAKEPHCESCGARIWVVKNIWYYLVRLSGFVWLWICEDALDRSARRLLAERLFPALPKAGPRIVDFVWYALCITGWCVLERLLRYFFLDYTEEEPKEDD